jgi:N-acetylglucosamine-6-phosphate deacetylase
LTGLAIWDDVNANAKSEPDEVKSLAAHGIVALATEHHTGWLPSTIAAFSPAGAVFADGHTRATYDIVLNHARSETTH